jgi:DNA uptake protein ComE-like DNA-binding protein
MRTKLAVFGLPLLGVCVAAFGQNRVADTCNAHATTTKVPSPENRVDINTATLDELIQVPGLTRAWANRIVRFRPYRTKADLDELGIIPGDLYDRIKGFIIAHHVKQ